MADDEVAARMADEVVARSMLDKIGMEDVKAFKLQPVKVRDPATERDFYPLTMEKPTELGKFSPWLAGYRITGGRYYPPNERRMRATMVVVESECGSDGKPYYRRTVRVEWLRKNGKVKQGYTVQNAVEDWRKEQWDSDSDEELRLAEAVANGATLIC